MTPLAATHRTCPWCESSLQLRFEIPGDWCREEDSSTRQLLWCASCRYGQVAPLPLLEATIESYPDGYYTHGSATPEHGALSLASRLRQHLAWRISHEVDDTPQWIAGFLPQLHGASMLDVGCGNGLPLLPFRAAGMNVTGVEPDKRAREVAAEHLDVVLPGLAEKLPSELQAAKFDCVRLCHVLEHCVDPAAALDAAIGALRPGGLLILETPNSEARGFDWQGPAWPWTDIPRHLHFFSATALRRAVEARGLRVEQVDYRGFGRQFTDHWLAREEQIHAALFPNRRQPRVVLRAWRLLLASLLAPRRRKYDSVFVVARLSE